MEVVLLLYTKKEQI